MLSLAISLVEADRRISLRSLCEVSIACCYLWYLEVLVVRADGPVASRNWAACGCGVISLGLLLDVMDSSNGSDCRGCSTSRCWDIAVA